MESIEDVYLWLRAVFVCLKPEIKELSVLKLTRWRIRLDGDRNINPSLSDLQFFPGERWFYSNALIVFFTKSYFLAKTLLWKSFQLFPVSIDFFVNPKCFGKFGFRIIFVLDDAEWFSGFSVESNESVIKGFFSFRALFYGDHFPNRHLYFKLAKYWFMIIANIEIAKLVILRMDKFGPFHLLEIQQTFCSPIKAPHDGCVPVHELFIDHSECIRYNTSKFRPNRMPNKLISASWLINWFEWNIGKTKENKRFKVKFAIVYQHTFEGF